MNRRPSKRFSPTWRSERLVPILLVGLGLLLLFTLVIVLLAVFGVLPG